MPLQFARLGKRSPNSLPTHPDRHSCYNGTIVTKERSVPCPKPSNLKKCPLSPFFGRAGDDPLVVVPCFICSMPWEEPPAATCNWIAIAPSLPITSEICNTGASVPNASKNQLAERKSSCPTYERLGSISHPSSSPSIITMD